MTNNLVRGVLTAGLGFALVATAHAQGRQIFPDNGDAKAQIRAALTEAKQDGKRVIVNFGGNWCGDCQVLDIYFHDPSNMHLLNQNYVLVDVNVGHYDQNLDLAQKFGIPLQKGVPALVILDPNGKVVYAQTHGEFEKMRRLESSDVTKFLMQWQPRHTAA